MKIKIGNKTFEVSKEELDGNPNELTLSFEGTLRTPEEEQTFVTNLSKTLHKAGEEIAVKQYREQFGFEGKSVEKLIEAVKTKTLEDAKIEPAEQLKKITQTLQEKETALQNALKTVSEKENEFKSYKNNTLLDRQLDSFIPDSTILPKDDIKLILKTRLKFDFDENGNILALDSQGNIIKDPTTANPKPAKDVIENFFKDNQTYLKPIQGGAGGSDSGSAGKKKTIDEFIKEQSEVGVKINSAEFNTALAEQSKAGLVDIS